MLSDDVAKLMDRFDRLEAQNRRLKWAVALVPILAFACGAGADLGEWKGKTVTAEQFLLVDAQGRKRAALVAEPDAANLVMWNEKGEVQARLSGDRDGNGPALFLLGDKPERVGATLRVVRPGRPILPQGGGYLGLFTEDEKPLVQACASGVSKIGGVSLFDDQGRFKGGIGGDTLK